MERSLAAVLLFILACGGSNGGGNGGGGDNDEAECHAALGCDDLQASVSHGEADLDPSDHDQAERINRRAV